MEYPCFSGEDTEMINRFSVVLCELTEAYYKRDPGKSCTLTYTLTEEDGCIAAEYIIRSGNRRGGVEKRIRAVWRGGYIKEFEKSIDIYPRGVYNRAEEKE